ncbi:MAG TPA: LysR family transcriptional regulator [Microlunatus sp.]
MSLFTSQFSAQNRLPGSAPFLGTGNSLCLWIHILRSPTCDLRLVAAVARLGSLGAAARELLVSQPSASQRLAALERRCGLRLFDRDNSGARPTAAGSAMSKNTFSGTWSVCLSGAVALPGRSRCPWAPSAASPCWFSPRCTSPCPTSTSSRSPTTVRG